MKKSFLLLCAFLIGLTMTACSFHTEKTFEAGVQGTVDFGKPKTPVVPKQPEATPTPVAPATEAAPTASAPSSNGKACHKDEECNKKDELCVFSACQSVSQLKSSFGFNDDFSNDPCEERPCANCTKGTQKKTGISYGYDEVNISASSCVDCQFNDECNEGFRCVNFQCVDAASNTYCDFFAECLEGFTCESNKCVKE